MPYPYDPRCYDLAVIFLKDVKGVTDMDRSELAEQIQRTIEDFISALVNPDAEGD